MAFMFSRAAWADLNGKKAARLTMLLNFPMFSTLSSTYNKHTVISTPPGESIKTAKRSEDRRPT